MTIAAAVTITEGEFRNRAGAVRMAGELDELADRLDTAGNLTPRAGYGLAVKIGLEVLEGTASMAADLSRATYAALENHEVFIVEMRTSEVDVHLQWMKVWVCREGTWMCERRLHVVKFDRATSRTLRKTFEGRKDLATEEAARMLAPYENEAAAGRASMESYLARETEGPCPCG